MENYIINTFLKILFTLIAFLCAGEVDFFVRAVIRLFPTTDVAIVDMYNIGNSYIYLCLIVAVSLLGHYLDISFYKDKLEKSRLFVAVETLILFVNLLIMGTVFTSLSHAKVNAANVLLIAVMSLWMLFGIISQIFYCLYS